MSKVDFNWEEMQKEIQEILRAKLEDLDDRNPKIFKEGINNMFSSFETLEDYKKFVKSEFLRKPEDISKENIINWEVKKFLDFY